MFALRLDVGLPPARHTVGDGAKDANRRARS
nr:MAG TPA: Herpesvirus BLRF2 protein [Crassvirales sp.]DAR16226.1 MAG TPA: Herpesvirus BLRF2 protein [Caudoviricetes sp.]